MDLEEELRTAFRIFKGGHGVNLGVKSPWWAKNIVAEEQEIRVYVWQPTPKQISMAEKILFEVLLDKRISDHERRLVMVRYGGGFKRSYRKCGQKLDCSHESARQQYQGLNSKLLKLFDEFGLFRS